MRDAFELDGVEHEIWLGRAPTGYLLHVGDARHAVALEPLGDGWHRLRVDGVASDALVVVHGDDVHLHVDGHAYQLRHRDALARLAAVTHSAADDIVRAPMPGTVIAVHVAPGQAVRAGEALLVMESMKLETAITAPHDGVVRALSVSVGSAFERDTVLVEFEPVDATGGSAR